MRHIQPAHATGPNHPSHPVDAPLFGFTGTAQPIAEGPPDPPKNDATPLAGGAGVNRWDKQPDSTARLQLVPPVRSDAPGTSHLAAHRIKGFAGTQRARVLVFIRSRGEHGATDPEIAAGIGIPIQSVNPRRGELAALGEIVLNGQTRPSPSGRPARVWIAAEFAAKLEGGAA